MESMIHLISEQLLAMSAASHLDDKNAEYLISHLDLIKTLFHACRTSLSTIIKLKQPKKRTKYAKSDEFNCKLKIKKIKEKQFVTKKLKVEVPFLQLTEEPNFIRDNSEEESSPSLLSMNHSSEISFKCYICKESYQKLHHFYDQLCATCADTNYTKRTQTCDFAGRLAIVTGCRIKIGYEICLYLLRHNCSVIGTTRFAKECFTRYSQEPDFDEFKSRLQIYSLNLRDLKGVYQFIDYLYRTCPRLDILINNAAQTLRRNVKFYENILDIESKPLEFRLPDASTVIISESTESIKSYDHQQELSLAAYQSQTQLLPCDFTPTIDDFPANIVDKDGQQVDLTKKTSWNMEINEINFLEFAETQVINTWAPFILCSKLKDLFLKGQDSSALLGKFIINVSSMEGKFTKWKSSKHVHTNMSKAALNMLTRTCGSEFARHGIYMKSVDTGWVSEMNPNQLYTEERTVPLDEVDGAMRVLDPIVIGINENKFLHSKFFKDYCLSTW